MEKALEETFLKMDILLSSPEGKKELQIIKSGGSGEDGAWNSESYAGIIFLNFGSQIFENQ